MGDVVLASYKVTLVGGISLFTVSYGIMWDSDNSAYAANALVAYEKVLSAEHCHSHWRINLLYTVLKDPKFKHRLCASAPKGTLQIDEGDAFA